jgi:hypothetical protein
MSVLDHARARRDKPDDPPIDREARLPLGIRIVVIGVLALLSWSVLILIGMALWSVL